MKLFGWNAFFQVKHSDTVADLGSGFGHVLASLNATRKVAIGPSNNEGTLIRRLYPEQIEIFQYVENVTKLDIDFLFSTSFYDYFICPEKELSEISKKVRNGGRVVSTN